VVPPDNSSSSAQTPSFQVLGVPVDGEKEVLLNTFDQFAEADAFLQFLSAGGKFRNLRVATVLQSPAQEGIAAGSPHQGRASAIPNRRVSEEPLLSPPRPGRLYDFFYLSSILVGGLLSLGSGFLGAIVAAVWLEEITGRMLGPGVVIVIGLAIAAVLTSGVVKVHGWVFRDK
jgi:hypothetical protein